MLRVYSLNGSVYFGASGFHSYPVYVYPAVSIKNIFIRIILDTIRNLYHYWPKNKYLNCLTEVMFMR